MAQFPNMPVLTYPKTGQLPLGWLSTVGAPGPRGSLNPADIGPKKQYFNGVEFDLDGLGDAVVRQYQIDYTGKSPSQGARDIDLNMIHFGRALDQPHGINVATKQRLPEHPISVMSLPRMNQWLCSHEGTAQYGGPDGPRKFCTDWRFVGMPMTAQTASTQSRSEQNVTFCIAKRMRMNDVWLSTGKLTAMNMELYLVANRVKRSSLTQLVNSSSSGREVKAAVGLDNVRSMDTDEDAKLPDTCVQLMPFSLNSGEKPPSVLETSGACVIFIGTVKETHGKVDLAFHRAQAKEAVYPITNSEDYKRKLVTLPQIVINVNLHT